MVIIRNTKELIVKNTEILPRGTGAKYLEVLVNGKEFIAIQWRRKLPNSLPAGRALIQF